MLFEIKNRFNGSVLFSLETESLKLCLEAAVESGADLDGAYLRGAYLRGAADVICAGIPNSRGLHLRLIVN